MNIVQLIHSLVARFEWKIHQMDAKSSFLHCDLYKLIYMDNPSSFVARQGNAHREVEEIRSFLENVDSTPIELVDWPTISSTLVK